MSRPARRPRDVQPAAAVLALVAVLLGGCASAAPTRPSGPASSPTTGPPSLSPLPQPEEPPPSGRLIADMRQSSIDASLGQVQVWVDNDTTRDVTPTRIRYRDPRFPRPVPGQRLRTDPAQSERGYPLRLPRRPRCGSSAPAESGTLEVRYAGRVDRVPVTDPTDVVGRYLAGRCQEIALAAVADLRWSDDVPPDSDEEGASATLTLLVRPTGDAGHRLVIDRVSGSYLLGSPDGPEAWAPHLTLAGDDPPARLELPLAPVRCDGHAFADGGGATAFRVSLVLDGTPGEVLLRMSPAGTGAALRYAARSCGLS